MNQNKKIIGIMATTEQGVIGCNNTLPWNYPEEMEHFRSTTNGHIVVMGKRTYDTTHESLAINRDLIVFSHDPNFTSNYAKIVNSLDEFLQYIQSLETNKKIFMIGGASIAHLFLERRLISSFILTKIHSLYPGDSYLDLRYFQDWQENILYKSTDYTIYKLIKPEEKS